MLLIAILIFVSLVIIYQFSYLEEIDKYGYNIQSLFIHPSFKTIFFVITNIMSTVGVIFIIIGTFYLLKKHDCKKDIFIYILTILCCLIITNLVKIIVKRTRPFPMLLQVSGYSFPSSHAAVAVVVYGYLILFIKKYYSGKRKKLYTFICLLFILLTGVSRIYFNVHYVTDVIAGFSLGSIFLCIGCLFMNRNLN